MYKIGDEIEITGLHRYFSAYPIGSICVITHINLNTNSYRVSRLGDKNTWFNYYIENIKKSTRQIRDEKLNILI